MTGPRQKKIKIQIKFGHPSWPISIPKSCVGFPHVVSPAIKFKCEKQSSFGLLKNAVLEFFTWMHVLTTIKEKKPFWILTVLYEISTFFCGYIGFDTSTITFVLYVGKLSLSVLCCMTTIFNTRVMVILCLEKISEVSEVNYDFLPVTNTTAYIRLAYTIV